MMMKFILLPWKPELVFIGISIMGINPLTQKFRSHVDLWDSIENNEYFSFECLVDSLKQIRKYEPFGVVETKGDKLSGSPGLNDVAGYIFGKNLSAENILMTTSVFTQAIDDKLSKVSIQIVLPMDKDLVRLPSPPTAEAFNLRKVEGGIAAVTEFSRKPTEEFVLAKEKELRTALLKDSLSARSGCLLAHFNDPGSTYSFVMTNEVLIWLNEFSLEYK